MLGQLSLSFFSFFFLSPLSGNHSNFTTKFTHRQQTRSPPKDFFYFSRL